MARCKTCEVEFPVSQLVDGMCPDCRSVSRTIGRSPDFSASSGLPQIESRPPSKTWLSTEAVAAVPVEERLGVVSAQCVLGVNIFKDIGAAFRDVVGGRSRPVEAIISDGRRQVLDDLRADADRLGADAVIAVSVQIQEIAGGGKSMLMLTAIGTAVRLSATS